MRNHYQTLAELNGRGGLSMAFADVVAWFVRAGLLALCLLTLAGCATHDLPIDEPQLRSDMAAACAYSTFDGLGGDDGGIFDEPKPMPEVKPEPKPEPDPDQKPVADVPMVDRLGRVIGFWRWEGEPPGWKPHRR